MPLDFPLDFFSGIASCGLLRHEMNACFTDLAGEYFHFFPLRQELASKLDFQPHLHAVLMHVFETA